MRLATWNCQTGLGRGWEVIENLDVDVLTVQECGPDTLQQVEARDGWTGAWQRGRYEKGVADIGPLQDRRSDHHAGNQLNSGDDPGLLDVPASPFGGRVTRIARVRASKDLLASDEKGGRQALLRRREIAQGCGRTTGADRSCQTC
jgi:hypothetical protein